MMMVRLSMPLLQLKKLYLCPVNPTKNKSTNQAEDPEID